MLFLAQVVLFPCPFLLLLANLVYKGFPRLRLVAVGTSGIVIPICRQDGVFPHVRKEQSMACWPENWEQIFSVPAVRAGFPIVAVDVGNNRSKLGYYGMEELQRGQQCRSELSLPNDPAQWDEVGSWIEARERVGGWWIATVNRPASTELIDWIRTHRPAEPIILLTASDVPLPVSLPRRDMVGIDRLVDAVAARYLRHGPHPVVVVDMGSAITVDLLSAQGVFEGGAILPGLGLSARALYEFTDMLPLIDLATLAEPPPPVGKNTLAAMASGLFWGALGAIRELAERMVPGSAETVEVILTGGSSLLFSRLLNQPQAMPDWPFLGGDPSYLRAASPLPGQTAVESEKARGSGQESRGRSRFLFRHVGHLTLLGIALTAASVLAETGEIGSGVQSLAGVPA
jgi:type III pantothenate kinase